MGNDFHAESAIQRFDIDRGDCERYWEAKTHWNWLTLMLCVQHWLWDMLDCVRYVFLRLVLVVRLKYESSGEPVCWIYSHRMEFRDIYMAKRRSAWRSTRCQSSSGQLSWVTLIENAVVHLVNDALPYIYVYVCWIHLLAPHRPFTSTRCVEMQWNSNAIAFGYRVASPSVTSRLITFGSWNRADIFLTIFFKCE